GGGGGAAGARRGVGPPGAGGGGRPGPRAGPAGARSGVLRGVATGGSRITAIGTQARPSGPVPFAAVSVNGGRTWRETRLPAPVRPVGVTALVTAGGGFLATGTLGDGSDQDVIVWWSRDGLTWHAVRPSGQWLHGPGAQQITGLSMAGGALSRGRCPPSP